MNLPPSTNEPTLLGIPREIRNQIYALVLSRAYICRQYVDDPTHEDGGYIATTLQDADLLAVSRQVRAESQPVLQSSSTLQFDSYLFALSEDGSNHPVQQPATKELEAALHSNRKILVSFSGHILSIDTNFADRVLISDPNPQPYYSRDGTKALSGMERDVARVFRYHEGDITTAIGPEILHDWLEEGARLTGPAAASIINCIIKNFPCRKLHAWSHWSFCVQHPDPDETEDVPPGSVEVRFDVCYNVRNYQIVSKRVSDRLGVELHSAEDAIATIRTQQEKVGIRLLFKHLQKQAQEESSTEKALRRSLMDGSILFEPPIGAYRLARFAPRPELPT